MASHFTTVDRIITGDGALTELGSVAAGFGSRAAVVSGRGALKRSGHLQRAIASLEAAGVSVVECPGVEPEPSVERVDRIRSELSGVDVIVSIGGGSVLDAGKAAAALAGRSEPTSAFHAGLVPDGRGLRHIAVPTTAGTGAEVTPNAVLSDASVPRKASIRAPGLLPDVAIADPELLVGLDAKVTIESGMDALVQAIESCVSIHATPITQALSLEAVSLLARGLIAAVEDPGEIQARRDCLYGSLAAGIALANARLGVVHGIAHPVGIRLGIPHGLACATLLVPSVRVNSEACAPMYDEIARRLAAGFSDAGTRGVTAPNLTQDDVARRAPRLDQLLEALLDRFEIPRTIDGLGEDMYGTIVDESMPSGSLKANPKAIAREDVETILKDVTP